MVEEDEFQLSQLLYDLSSQKERIRYKALQGLSIESEKFENYLNNITYTKSVKLLICLSYHYYFFILNFIVG